MARRGRPTKAPPLGEKASLGLKVTASLKSRLEKAAAESGRTQSQEAEARLERSFDRQDLMPDVLTAAYGRRAAGYLMLMGRAFVDVGRIAGRMAEPTTSNLDSWTENRWARTVAMEAVVKVMDMYVKPDDDDEPSKPPAIALELLAKHGKSIAETMADGISRAVIGFVPPDDHYTEFAKSVRPLLNIGDGLVQISAESFAAKMASLKDDPK